MCIYLAIKILQAAGKIVSQFLEKICISSGQFLCYWLGGYITENYGSKKRYISKENKLWGFNQQSPKMLA